jgi:hypothetical protein
MIQRGYMEELSASQTRIAVLEKIAETHDRRISDIEDFHRAVVERFDEKIQLDAANQVAMERTLSKAVTSLDNLSVNLQTTLTLASDASKIATKHETMGITVVKISSALVVIGTAAWAIFKFFIGA